MKQTFLHWGEIKHCCTDSSSDSVFSISYFHCVTSLGHEVPRNLFPLTAKHQCLNNTFVFIYLGSSVCFYPHNPKTVDQWPVGIAALHHKEPF